MVALFTKMLLVLSEEHKEHLSFLPKVDTAGSLGFSWFVPNITASADALLVTSAKVLLSPLSHRSKQSKS